jgi:endo-1,4-beta-xylanase
MMIQAGKFGILRVVLCGILFGACAAYAQVVATYDFEDGTAQGWVSFNGATAPVNTTSAAQSGTHSLLTTTGSSGQGGPSINASSTLLPGATYTITGFVMLTPGETATNANFTIKRTDPTCSGGTCFDTIGPFQVPVNASGWAQIGGSYTVSLTETGLTLYAQLVGPSTATSFYLDNVVITETAPPPSGTPLATYTWADGGLDGWTPFGSPTLTNAAPPVLDPQGDSRALLVSNRTSGFMGPALNFLSLPGITAGATYQVVAYVMLTAADSTNPTATISTKTTNCANTSGIFGNVATSAALSSTAWTKIQGNFSFSNTPGPPTSLTLYIQSNSATDSFYVGHVTISQVAAPPNPANQDNTGISTDFEDGAADGWAGRAGATVTNVVGGAHGGNNSLLITGRTGNFDGPAINVSNKMYNGSKYAISVWVKLQPTDGTTHNIQMSLQTTLNGTTSFPGVNGFPGTRVTADGQWHQISVPSFNMANAYDPGMAFLYLQTFPSSGTDLVSFSIDDFQLTYVAPPTPQLGLPSLFQTLSYFFPLGAAVDTIDLSGPHADLLTHHFNSLVAGNDMKWSSVESTKGTFNYTNADNEVGLAVCHNMQVRGHNLVWANGSQTPSYAFGDGTNSPANQATVIANIQEHIQNEVQHFGNKVYVWDVVNEPLDASQPDCLSHGPFYNVLGKSYIDVALQAARQFAPPGTKLFINDFNTAIPNRLACLVQVIQDLKSRGIPLDGVGHESHNAINFPSTASMVNAINTIATQFPDLDQQITELDVTVYNGGDNTSNFGANGGTVPASILAEQGYLYWQYFDALRQLKGKLSAVTIWGIADDDTWLDSFPINRLDMPLPFDIGLQAKPAYWGMVDPTQLPGWGLNFQVSSKAGPANARVWTITATNPSSNGPAYNTRITGFTLTQTSGAACTPVVTPPSAFPVMLGDIPASSSMNTAFTIDFSSCSALSRFTLSMPWTSAVYYTGTLVSGNQFR